MTGGPDLFMAGDTGFAFDDEADRRDSQRALLWLALAITLVVGVVMAAVWWFDRVATPPAIPQVRHALARLEERP